MHAAHCSMDSQRLFIACPPSEALRAKCLALQERGRRQGLSMRWTRAEQIHLTLVFLGEIGRDACHLVEERLRVAAEGCRPFALKFSGLGVFPSLSPPRVLWVGVSETPILMALQKDIHKGMVDIGLPLEDRPFHPHLTLGRFRTAFPDENQGRAALLSQWMKAEGDLDFEACDIRMVELIESRLQAQGSQYDVRLRVDLEGTEKTKN